jgi:hypothetical protein
LTLRREFRRCRVPAADSLHLLAQTVEPGAVMPGERGVTAVKTFFIGVYPGLTSEMLEFVIERFHAFFRERVRASA